MFTENGRNDHVTLFNLHLPFSVFCFLVKFSSFALASKAGIIKHYAYFKNSLIIQKPIDLSNGR